MNSSFGEFDGVTRVSSHDDWIYANMVPEPGSLVLAAIGMLAIAARLYRRRHSAVARDYTEK